MTAIATRCLILLLTCLPLSAAAVDLYSYRITDQLPQSRENFVQGLQILDDYLYVSSGNYGQSKLLRYHWPAGTLDKAYSVHPRIFAEGVTVLGDKIYQLTWRNRMVLVYDKAGLVPDHWFAVPDEGWGLTHNGSQLVYSDGSSQLHFISPQTQQIVRSIQVTENGQPLEKLNELEWVEGKIWANIWQTDRIVIIDPDSGRVTASIDLRGLLPADARQRGTDVLNGIARDPADGSIWVTGKRWPWLYQIELLPQQKSAEEKPTATKSR